MFILFFAINLVSGLNYGMNQRTAAEFTDGGETTTMLDAMVQLMLGTPGEFDRDKDTFRGYLNCKRLLCIDANSFC